MLSFQLGDGTASVLTEGQHHGLLDLIHAAALDPAGWDAVLRMLADRTGCIAGGLTVEAAGTRHGRPITYFGFDPGHVEQTFDHFLPLNPLFGIADRLRPGTIVTNGDVIPTDAFRRTEFYDGWARPQGLCSPITLILHRRSDVYIPLTLVRRDGSGEASDQDRALLSKLAPHLAQALRTNLHLGLLQAATRRLEQLAHGLSAGVLVVDSGRRVTYANAAAKTVFAAGILRLRGGMLGADDGAFGRALQRAMAKALAKDTPVASELSHHTAHGRISVTVTPLAPDAGGMPGGPGGQCCLLVVNDETAILRAVIQAAGRRYRLTPAELRLLQALLDGLALGQAATALGIAHSTAATHLQGLFAKTGTRRQVDLVKQVMLSTPAIAP